MRRGFVAGLVLVVGGAAWLGCNEVLGVDEPVLKSPC
jgi:hypothetical protein